MKYFALFLLAVITTAVRAEEVVICNCTVNCNSEKTHQVSGIACLALPKLGQTNEWNDLETLCSLEGGLNASLSKCDLE